MQVNDLWLAGVGIAKALNKQTNVNKGRNFGPQTFYLRIGLELDQNMITIGLE